MYFDKNTFLPTFDVKTFFTFFEKLIKCCKISWNNLRVPGLYMPTAFYFNFNPLAFFADLQLSSVFQVI